MLFLGVIIYICMISNLNPTPDWMVWVPILISLLSEYEVLDIYIWMAIIIMTIK